jgi:hypothetical protein
MARNPQIVVEYVAKTAALKSGIDDAAKQTDGFASKLKGLAKGGASPPAPPGSADSSRPSSSDSTNRRSRKGRRPDHLRSSSPPAARPRSPPATSTTLADEPHEEIRDRRRGHRLRRKPAVDVHQHPQ